jgi:Zn-finger nucleic acid-binding protein
MTLRVVGPAWSATAGLLPVLFAAMVYRELRWLCPRDGARLEAEQIGKTRFMRCVQCRGVLVELGDLVAMCDEMGGYLPEREVVTGGPPMPCPVCAVALAKSRFGRIEVDSCRDHGVWFDRNELAWLLESIGLEALRRRQ